MRNPIFYTQGDKFNSLINYYNTLKNKKMSIETYDKIKNLIKKLPRNYIYLLTTLRVPFLSNIAFQFQSRKAADNRKLFFNR